MTCGVTCVVNVSEENCSYYVPHLLNMMAKEGLLCAPNLLYVVTKCNVARTSFGVFLGKLVAEQACEYNSNFVSLHSADSTLF